MADKTYKLTFKLSNGELKEVQFTVPEGEPGNTPYIGDNGNWYIGETDTGVKTSGKDGLTPYIGLNGNWYIGDDDTGVKAEGNDGITPHIGSNGNWFIGDTDTGTKAAGKDGENGQDGKSAYQYAQDGGYTGTEEEFAQKLASEGSSAPADWNAAEGEPGHVLNRTHWREVRKTVLFERTVTVTDSQFLDASGISIPLNVGETYSVVWDGVSYETAAKAVDYNGLDAIMVGNEAFANGENTGEPFMILSIANAGFGGAASQNGEHTFTISGNEYTYHTIPPEYLAGSKPFYIDLGTDPDDSEILYETDVTVNEVKNALTSGYQVVVRRALGSKNYYDFFFMDSQENDQTLLFYRIYSDWTRMPRCELLEFTPNNDGGYDITYTKQEIANPTALKNPYALTINGTKYDGSKAVNMTIKGDSGDSVPDYVREEAERVAKVVQSRQNANTITFLACSDIHYSSPNNTNPILTAESIHEATLHMGQAMGIIRSLVHIDFAAMFGDMVRDNGEVSVEEVQNEVRFVNSCLHEGFSGIPAFRLEGNHDEAYESGVGLSAGQVFANIHAWNVGSVYGDRSAGYCYRDFEDMKLRVICLNTTEGSGSSITVSAEQNTWLGEVLDLSEKGDDWRSIILSHHPLDFSRSGGVDPVPTVKNAVGLIGTFHGHIHNFLVDYINGTEVKRITIPNAVRDQENSYTTNNGVNFAESTKYPKTAGTAEDTSFCVVTIDLAEQKIYADHYGAGYSREIDYTYKSPSSGFTNLVPLATTTYNGTEIYNGIGYKNATYISSGGAYSGDENTVAVGYLPLNPGDVIYIKGAELAELSHVRIYTQHAADGSVGHYFEKPSVSSGIWNNTAGTKGFTIEELGDKYYKLTPEAALFSSKHCFRTSLKGTGENLIITINEPIE